MSIDETILSELREQTKWLRLLGMQALRPLLDGTLQTDKHRLIYELTDGKRTTRDVAAAAAVGVSTVNRLWQDWLAVGVCLEVPGKAGRAEHLTSLARLGIEVPEVAPGAPKAPVEMPPGEQP